jgi:hypothetical protein
VAGRAKDVAAWVCVALLVLLILGALSDQLWAAAALLTAATLAALPPMRSTWGRYGLGGGKRALVAALLATGGLTTLGITAPPSPKRPSEAPSGSTADPQRAPVSVAAPQPASKPARDPQSEAAATLRQETQALWNALVKTTAPCDAAAKEVGTATASGDVYSAYPVVKRGETVCQEAWLATRSLSAPASSTGEVEELFEKAIKTCSQASFARSSAFESMLKVIDGDSRPSAVNEAKEALTTAGMGPAACVAGMMAAAEKGHVDMAIFKG